MKLLVGLGNPGKKYAKTRHNTGWLVLDSLATKMTNDKWQTNENSKTQSFKFEKNFNAETLKVENVILAKPQTFMNSSGEAVKKLSDFYKIRKSDLYIIHDDLDIPLGKYKIQKGKGPELHYGVKSVEQELGTKEFWRVRVGIDNRDSTNRVHGEEYTLQEFSDSEEKVRDDVIREVEEKLLKVI